MRRVCRSITPVLFALLLVAHPVAAEDDPDLAALRAAAEQGQVEAQYELAVLYEFGFDLPDHKVDAFVWYSRAAERGSRAAAGRRDRLRALLTPTELARARARLQQARRS